MKHSIPSVVLQHADNAAALALDRFYVWHSPNYDLSDLQHLESRLEGNIDGLVIAGADNWPFYEKHLAAEEYGEVFTIALLEILLKNNEIFHVAFDQAGTDQCLLNAIADAFVWLTWNNVSDHLQRLYEVQDVRMQYVALAAFEGHRRLDDTILLDALRSSNDLMQESALRAVGELGKTELVSYLKAFLTSETEALRFAANWSLARLGDSRGIEAVKPFLVHPRYGESALQLVVLQKDEHDTVDVLRDLYQEKATRRLAIYGMGLLGNPKAVAPLIELMSEQALARVAGEAFCLITGIDLEQADLDQDAPADFEAGPDENPGDDDVAMDPDEDLPWPNPDLIARWWQHNQARFLPTRRYLLGGEVSLSQWQYALARGRQKYREFAALAIAIHQPGQAMFNVRAPAIRQKRLLG